MNNLQLRISLPGTDPLVWREVVVSPDAELEELHLIIQAVMNWDNCHMHLFRGSGKQLFDPEEDAYYDVVLKKLLPRKGGKLWYIYDFGDSWEHIIEVVGKVPEEERETPYLVGGANAAPPEDSGGIPGYQQKIDILADSNHPEYEETLEWMTGPFDDPFDPTSFDLEDTALYLCEVMEEFLDDLAEPFDEELFDEKMEFIDLDAGRKRKIDFDWLRKEHGIPLTEDHVRQTPKEIIDFLKIAEAEDDPEPFVKEAERLLKKHPGELNIHMALLAMYQYLGKEVLATRLAKKMPHPSPDDILFNLGFIMESLDDETFVKRVSRMPQPLKLTNLPPGKGGLYHVDEFLYFELLAIRYALDKKKLEDAVDRLDRLIQVGYLHDDVRTSAMMIAAAQIEMVQSLIAEPKKSSSKETSAPSKPVSPRTQEIIDTSVSDVLTLIKLQASSDFLDDDEGWDFSDDPLYGNNSGQNTTEGAKVIGLDPFRHLGRNDRIKVRDMKTGDIQESVKFKLVEARLRNGELELM